MCAVSRIRRSSRQRMITVVHADRDTAELHRMLRCSACGSHLIHPVIIRPLSRRRAAITRQCPDCQSVDVVTTSRLSARIWREREARIGRDLTAAAHNI
jgi:hypothetical protein